MLLNFNFITVIFQSTDLVLKCSLENERRDDYHRNFKFPNEINLKNKINRLVVK